MKPGSLPAHPRSAFSCMALPSWASELERIILAEAGWGAAKAEVTGLPNHPLPPATDMP